ncbi:EamA family transporter [Piscibacillus salipiscarius]|uniref:EamA family transporter n=1 Tax=Piscibacillus salipiscarius TaxID=299480 RepID=A0ABW5Q841_9BACI
MKINVLLVLLAAVLWGTTGTAQALAPDKANPLTVGALRLFIGGGALFVYISLQKNIDFKSIPKMPLLVSALAMALYQPFFFTGVDLTGVAIGTVVAICSAPIFAGFIELFFYKRFPDWVWLLSTIFAVIGCVLLLQSGEEVTFNPFGMLYSLAAGGSFATYTFVSKTLVAKHPPDVVVALVFTTAAIMLLPILLTSDLTWTLERSGAISVLHLGIVATALSYVLFARGLKGITASTAVTLALAEPLTATLLGVCVLNEKISVIASFGLVLLVMGLLALSFKEHIKKRTVT